MCISMINEQRENDQLLFSLVPGFGFTQSSLTSMTNVQFENDQLHLWHILRLDFM